jgi:hypothetical protein
MIGLSYLIAGFLSFSRNEAVPEVPGYQNHHQPSSQSSDDCHRQEGLSFAGLIFLATQESLFKPALPCQFNCQIRKKSSSPMPG